MTRFSLFALFANSLLLPLLLLIAVPPTTRPFAAASTQFDPYQLNGGLVAAVAGKHFCILAADTRLTGSSGFEILQRHHTSSRLWSLLPSHQAAAIQDELQRRAQSATTTMEKELDDYKQETVVLSPTSVKDTIPVWVGSVGCSTDCEELKRICQTYVRRNLCTGEMSVTSSSSSTQQQPGLPASLAVWLGQVLYGRRGFPYYAFCVLAGCNARGGHVYGYDAIGSYERLAVAVAGQGRDLLQSILDRSFHCDTANTELPDDTKNNDLLVRVQKTPTQVAETAQETTRVLIQAFRAVAKREASVGDSLVLLCWEYNAKGDCIQPSITFASLPEN